MSEELELKSLSQPVYRPAAILGVVADALDLRRLVAGRQVHQVLLVAEHLLVKERAGVAEDDDVADVVQPLGQSHQSPGNTQSRRTGQE